MLQDTVCVHGAALKDNPTGAVCQPIYQSATFSHPSTDQSTGYDYSRLQNPTRSHLEEMICHLENADDAIAFSTGMAAIANLIELLGSGDKILASHDLYGGTVRLFDNVIANKGILVEYVDTSDLELVVSKIDDATKILFCETLTNPMMNVTDIAGLKKIIGTRDILLAVDNTFLTPYCCNPIELGADVVIHSGSKYLSGHNDTLAGFLVSAHAELSEKLRYISKTLGACLSPFDSYLLIRGIKTLALRMDRSQKSTLKIAEWLSAHPRVNKVFFCGLPSHPGYSVMQKQSKGFGAMISFEVDSQETAKYILNHLQIVTFAESLGGVESLMTYPLTQTHADVPLEKRLQLGINEKLLRFSVGIENPQDLIEDLEQAFPKV
ncbi:trans-sulfuration enzyme family protein [Scatolibacter rhodanostii]|uniref:trans-sulfuration enzyme family protein n=1 Tax=Scatolibacter rhodanostii TaxID=2014781 RepID=UPI000C084755|nr:PLP-dependent aspartate aminotransferase family protein [Scatolibacter rhodanostii]